MALFDHALSPMDKTAIVETVARDTLLLHGPVHSRLAADGFRVRELLSGDVWRVYHHQMLDRLVFSIDSWGWKKPLKHL